MAGLVGVSLRTRLQWWDPGEGRAAREERDTNTNNWTENGQESQVLVVEYKWLLSDKQTDQLKDLLELLFASYKD